SIEATLAVVTEKEEKVTTTEQVYHCYRDLSCTRNNANKVWLTSLLDSRKRNWEVSTKLSATMRISSKVFYLIETFSPFRRNNVFIVLRSLRIDYTWNN